MLVGAGVGVFALAFGYFARQHHIQCVQAESEAYDSGIHKMYRLFQGVKNINECLNTITATNCELHPELGIKHTLSREMRRGMKDQLQRGIAELPKGDMRVAGYAPILSYLCKVGDLSSPNHIERYKQVRVYLEYYNSCIDLYDVVDDEIGKCIALKQNLSSSHSYGVQRVWLNDFLDQRIEKLKVVRDEIKQTIQESSESLKTIRSSTSNDGLYPNQNPESWEPLKQLKGKFDRIEREYNTINRRNSPKASLLNKVSEEACACDEHFQEAYDYIASLAATAVLAPTTPDDKGQGSYAEIQDDQIVIHIPEKGKMTIYRDGSFDYESENGEHPPGRNDGRTLKDDIRKDLFNGMRAFLWFGSFASESLLGLPKDDFNRLGDIWIDGMEEYPEYTFNVLYYTFTLKNALENGTLCETVLAESGKIYESGLDGNKTVVQNQAWSLYHASKFLMQQPVLCTYGSEVFQAGKNVIDTADRMEKNAAGFDPTFGGTFSEEADEWMQSLKAEDSVEDNDGVSPLERVYDKTTKLFEKVADEVSRKAKSFDTSYGELYNEEAQEWQEATEGEEGHIRKALEETKVYQWAISTSRDMWESAKEKVRNVMPQETNGIASGPCFLSNSSSSSSYEEGGDSFDWSQLSQEFSHIFPETPSQASMMDLASKVSSSNSDDSNSSWSSSGSDDMSSSWSSSTSNESKESTSSTLSNDVEASPEEPGPSWSDSIDQVAALQSEDYY